MKSRIWYLNWKLHGLLAVVATLLVAVQLLREPVNWGAAISYALVAVPIIVFTISLYRAQRHA